MLSAHGLGPQRLFTTSPRIDPMCYHKQDRALKGQLEQHYDATLRDISYAPSFYENGFDFKPSPVIAAGHPKEFQSFRWGLIPWWTKSADDARNIRVRTLNCISEEMFDKSSFKDAAREGKRCLIPATGFFEWRWLDGKGKTKVPYFIFAKSQEIFSLAGLYSHWVDKSTGEEINTYTVLTTRANSLMTKIHNSKRRMPVIMKKEYEKDWLNPNLTEGDVLALCEPVGDDFLDAYTISRKIGSTSISTEEKNNSGITDKVDYPELALLDS